MSKNLQLRIIFGLLYAASIVGMLLWGKMGAIILLSIFGLLVLWEFNNISLYDHPFIHKILFTAINIPFVAAAYSQLKSSSDLYPLLVISLVYGLSNIYFLFLRKKTTITGSPRWFHMLLYITLSFLIGIVGASVIEGFNLLILYLFLMVWLCDVGAYFIGKGFGKRKLFPIISPNKTWAGFYGSLAAGSLTSMAIYWYTGLYTLLVWICIGILVCITSVLGDLIESSFKRHFNIKDSSNLIPGHGGFFDRLDSFVFALPFYTMFILIFEK